MTTRFSIRIAHIAIATLALGLTASVGAQQITTTNCNVNGSTINCTSNTTDYAAQPRHTMKPVSRSVMRLANSSLLECRGMRKRY
jgi:hypothetical protein